MINAADVWKHITTKIKPKIKTWAEYTNLRVNESARYSIESLFRPREEPIDCCTVDNTRKIPTSVAKIISCRAHTQGHVKTSCAIASKPFPHSLPGNCGRCSRDSSKSCFSLRPNSVNDTFFVFVSEEGNKTSCGEDVIYELKEA